MTRRVAVFVALVIALTSTSCAAAGRARPGPTRPTIGPRLPDQPGYLEVRLGVLIRNRYTNAIVTGRIAIKVDMVDRAGNRGTAAGHKMPWETIVDSGWEFPVQIQPGYRDGPITFVIEASVDERARGDVLSCAIWEATGVGFYYDQEFREVDRDKPWLPVRVFCNAVVTPPPAPGGQ